MAEQMVWAIIWEAGAALGIIGIAMLLFASEDVKMLGALTAFVGIASFAIAQ